MTWIVTLAARLGIPEVYARLALTIAAITLLGLGLGLAKCSYDRRLIAQHDAMRDLSLAEGARAADANAADQRRADDARLSTDSIQLDKVIANASLAPLSPARRRYYDCLVQQQTARASRAASACD
jgi:hypothetical protein